MDGFAGSSGLARRRPKHLEQAEFNGGAADLAGLAAEGMQRQTQIAGQRPEPATLPSRIGSALVVKKTPKH
jgi:hypothetical protein